MGLIASSHFTINEAVLKWPLLLERTGGRAGETTIAREFSAGVSLILSVPRTLLTIFLPVFTTCPTAHP